MKINLSYGVQIVRELYQDGQISSNDMEEVTDFILTYSLYEAAVSNEIASLIEPGVKVEDTERAAHEMVVLRLIKDLDKKRKATL